MSVTSGGTAPNGCRSGGSWSASAGSAGIEITFSTLTVPSVGALPQPHRGREVRGRGDDADEPVGLRRVVRRPQLEHHLVLRPEVDLLRVRALVEVPDVQLVAVLVAQQQLADQAVLDHVRRAPLGRDDRAEVEVPPEVVGQLLRAAVVLPRALDREVVVVEQEDAARAVALGVAERRDVDPVRPAVDRVRARVAGLGGDLVLADRLDDLRVAALGVDDVDVRGAQARDEQVAALDVRMRRPRAQRRGARVPAEVVQLVADVGHVEPPGRPGRRWTSPPAGRSRSARPARGRRWCPC